VGLVILDSEIPQGSNPLMQMTIILNLYNMETTSKVDKIASNVVGFLARLLLTLFAGFFGFMSLVALFMSIVDKDFVSVVGSVAAAAIALVCWSLRK
jgi:hypothetical protein